MVIDSVSVLALLGLFGLALACLFGLGLASLFSLALASLFGLGLACLFAFRHKRPPEPLVYHTLADVQDILSGKHLPKVKAGVEKIGSQVNENDSASTTPSKKSRTVSHPPPKPSTHLLKYNTDHYTKYSPSEKNTALKVTAKFSKFEQYDNYTLFMDHTVTEANFNDKVPTEGVRLDDRTAAIALLTQTGKTLARYWPADFDQAGMVRATRVPLGHAYKLLVKAGEQDFDGNIVAEDGYYYQWWRGIHCLMGKEGLDAGFYMIRPSFEDFLCTKFTFKISGRAVVQHRSGFLGDPTFSAAGE